MNMIHVRSEQFGNYLEDFIVGDTYKHWPGRTITESDNTNFCMLTMNHHPLHIDSLFASDTQFQQRVVGGSLVYSVVFGISVPDISGKAIANLTVDSLEHVAPVFIGDTLYGESDIIDIRTSSTRKDRGIITVETRGFNQNNELVLRFKRKVMIPKKQS